MGLPTPEDPSVKKSNLVILKEKDRLSKLTSRNPAYMYLIETISNLVRCISVDLPEGFQVPAGEPVTPY